MRLRKKTLIAALALSSVSVFPFSTQASPVPVDLSGLGWVTYGDANSYALNIDRNIEVMSGPGQIDLFTKLGLNTQLGNPTPGMDDAFDTPTDNNTEGFRMGTANEPGGGSAEGTWDRIGWWDSSLAALNTALDLVKNSIVFFFANNETGKTPDLAAWARVELTGPGGVLLGRFDMTNDPGHDGQSYGPPPLGGGVPFGSPGAYTSNGAAPYVSDFVDSGNDVCTDASGNLVSCLGPYANLYHENLGGDRAAYAIVVPELDALIRGITLDTANNLGNYALHVDYRLGCGPELTQAGGGFPTATKNNKTFCADNYALNGGDEKVFIGTQLATDVPEPSTVALAGLSLLGLGTLRRRQRA